MARYDRQIWDASGETRASVDDLIRPGLSRAFPLPDQSHADERFTRLLEALARVGKATSQGAELSRMTAS